MTVSSQTSSVSYLGDGVTTLLPVPYYFLDETDLVVTRVNADASVDTLVLGSDYSVSGAGVQSGGAVTMLSPPLTGSQIIIDRVVPVTQETDYVANDPFPAESHERALDKLTMLVQQAFSYLSRALLRPVGKNDYDAQGRKIVNLGDGSDEQDTVNIRTMRSYVDTAIAGVVGGFGFFIQNFTGAVLRTFQDKMRDEVSVKDFGGNNDGIFNNAAAIVAMDQALGYVVFSHGAHATNSVTISGRVYFEPGAYLIANPGQTVNINNAIDSSRQYIFRGAGSYVLGHSTVTDSGEQAREIHVSWFGAFPSPDPGPDQAPFIQKAMDAVGNLREARAKHDIGNYNISSQVLVSRGTLFVGEGTRRTVFKLDNDGYSVFKTNGVAVKFEGIQFELHSGLTTRTSPYIEIAHGECTVDDAYFTAPAEGILLTSNNARIRNIMAVYGTSPGAGSSLVHVAGGSNNHIDGVLLPTSQFAPESIVRVGGTASTVSGTIVEDLNYITPGIGVLIDAVGTVGRTTISKLNYNGGTVAKPDSLVTVRSSGAALVETVRISGLTTNSNSSAVVRLEQGSSADMRDITVSDITAAGATAGNIGDGIVITKSGTGALKGVILADSINVRRRLNQLTITPAGALSESYISPALINDVEPCYTYTFTIPDDTAVEIDFQRDMFVGRVDVAAGVSNYGQFTVRSAPTPSINNISVSANVNTLVSVLTGTTGVDGKLTVAPQPKKFYIENRLGSTQTVICVVSGTFA